LERLLPADFRPKANFPEVEDSSLPEAWPISYADLEPYYRQAEQLFRVRGTPDPFHPAASGPLLEPPPLAERDRHVRDLFVRRGLHPYRVHVGCEFVDGCAGCGGVVCLRGCKADAGWICLVPALEKFGARLLPSCEVSRLEADRSAVTALRCSWRGSELSIAARVFVLAAGAFMTPVLLLHSRSDAWPEGLANHSGLVGRNLMMHSGDLIAVRPERSGSRIGPVKSLALNDFYFCEGRKLGNLQSLGIPVSTGNVLAHLRTVVDRNPRWWAKLARPWLRVGARFGAFYFRNDVVFASIVEDLPYHRNRVVLDPSARNGMRFEYHYPEELRERNALFRRRLAQALGRGRVFCLTSENNLNFGHPCGTCRFGTDPAASVLDPNNRAHGVDNLYVVDASFFPSSGGANPSLTIAANALRVAEVIHGQLSPARRVAPGAGVPEARGSTEAASCSREGASS
jgi:choline dehydrogenase-like flavoprotein